MAAAAGPVSKGTKASPRRSSSVTAPPVTANRSATSRRTWPSTAPTSSEETSTRLVSSSATSRRFWRSPRRYSRAWRMAMAASSPRARASSTSAGPKIRSRADLDEHEHAEPFAVHDERHVETGLLAPLLHGRAHVLGQRRIGERLLGDLPAAQDLTVRGVVVQRVDPALFERRRPLARAVVGAEDDGVADGVVLVDHALPRLERLRRRAADARQRVLQRHRGGDGPRPCRAATRGSGSAPAAGGRAARCGPRRRRGPRAEVTSSQSSSVKRRPSRFSISVRQPTTPLSRKRSGTASVATSPHCVHGGAVGRVEIGVVQARERAGPVLDDGHVAGTVVQRRSSCRPRRGRRPSARAPRAPRR